MKYFVSILACISLSGCNNEEIQLEANNPNIKTNNGVLAYKEKPFSGHLITYFESGKIESFTKYRNGRKDGIERYWYPNAAPATERAYKNGIKTGKHRGWYSNGKLNYEYQFNDKGFYQGVQKEWYASGKLAKRFNYQDGNETGRQQLWKTNGDISANYDVVNGERYGLIGLKNCTTYETY